MNRDDIIRMAREAEHLVIEDYYTNGPVRAFSEAQLERFTALVASAERNRTWTQAHWTEYEHAIVAQEREACAKVCEDIDAWNMDDPSSTAAKAIRARGQG